MLKLNYNHSTKLASFNKKTMPFSLGADEDRKPVLHYDVLCHSRILNSSENGRKITVTIIVVALHYYISYN